MRSVTGPDLINGYEAAVFCRQARQKMKALFPPNNTYIHEGWKVFCITN